MPGAAQYVAHARAVQRSMVRLPGLIAVSMRHCLEGWFKLLEGDQGAALGAFRSSEEGFKGSALAYEAGIKYTIGMLEGGESGKQRCAEVLAKVQAEGFRDIRRGLRFRVPANLELLES
jgi:hypothetical protein